MIACICMGTVEILFVVVAFVVPGLSFGGTHWYNRMKTALLEGQDSLGHRPDAIRNTTIHRRSIMGWGCRQDAGIVLRAIYDFCIASTGSQNCWTTNRGKYMFEVGREQRDGAICATISKFTADGKHVTRAGSLRIEGDGKVTRGPAVFKNLPVLFADIDGFRVQYVGEHTQDKLAEGLIAMVQEWEQSYEPGGCNVQSGPKKVKDAKVIDRHGNVLEVYVPKTQPMFQLMD